MEELVSIVMPTYNSALFIEESLNSVISQEYINWELLIIDDKSTDSTVKIIEKVLENEKRIKLVKLNENKGQAYARNIGIKKSKGEYLTFIDSDDLWNEKFLSKMISFMKVNNLNIAYSSFERMNESLSESFGVLHCKKEVSFRDLLKNNYLSCLSTIINIKNIGKVYFLEEYKHEDHIFWLHILKNKVSLAIGLDENLATYRIRKNSTSRNKIKAAKWKWIIYRSYLKFSVIKSSYYYCYYLFWGIIKNIRFIINKK